MKTSEAFWMFLPQGLDELFEMVALRAQRNRQYDIWLDEKKKLAGRGFRNPNIVAAAYTETLQSAAD